MMMTQDQLPLIERQDNQQESVDWLREAEIQQVAFVAVQPTDQRIVLELPTPTRRWAVSVPRSADINAAVPVGQLEVMTVSTTGQQQPDADSLAAARGWVEAAVPAGPPSLFMTLQGTQIFWSPNRIALFATVDRSELIIKAILAATFFEAELRSIEMAVAESWPQLETDMPLAFEFQERALPQRKQLQQRFQQTVSLRARLARISPQVNCPHVYPPTLASQIGERLRERTHMADRYEFVDEQIEVFEGVYEACGERASNYTLTRSGNLLEWIIIVLLCTQVLLAMFELLTSLSVS